MPAGKACGHCEIHGVDGRLDSSVVYYFFLQSDLGWVLLGDFS